MQFGRDSVQTCWKRYETVADIGVYRARIGLFSIRQCKLVNSYDINIVRIAHNCFFWNCKCCYVDDLRSGIESRDANGRKAE